MMLLLVSAERKRGDRSHQQDGADHDDRRVYLAVDGSGVRFADADAVLGEQRLPSLAHQMGRGSGIRTGNVANAHAAVAALRSRDASHVAFADRRGQSTGSGSHGGGKPAVRSHQGQGISSVDVDQRGPGHHGRRKDVSDRHRFVRDLKCWTPKTGPRQPSDENNECQELPRLVRRRDADSHDKRRTDQPDYGSQDTIESGMEHPSIVAGTGR